MERDLQTQNVRGAFQQAGEDRLQARSWEASQHENVADPDLRDHDVSAPGCVASRDRDRPEVDSSGGLSHSENPGAATLTISKKDPGRGFFVVPNLLWKPARHTGSTSFPVIILHNYNHYLFRGASMPRGYDILSVNFWTGNSVSNRPLCGIRNRKI